MTAWKRGDKATATLRGRKVSALVLETGKIGVKIKIAQQGLNGQWYTAVYAKPVPATKLVGRDTYIDGLDFE